MVARARVHQAPRVHHTGVTVQDKETPRTIIITGTARKHELAQQSSAATTALHQPILTDTVSWLYFSSDMMPR